MKKFRNKGVVLFLSILMVFSVSSCDIFDLDVNTDPNNPSQASLNLLFSNAILNASSTFAADLNDSAMGFMSLTTSSDDHNMTYSTWNTQWNYLYENPLTDLDRIIVAAKEAGNVPKQLGAAQVMKCYYFTLMVDLWGDVPYSEAFQGDQGVKTPVFDKSKDIYANLLATLDEAIANLSATSSAAIGGDLIYNGNVTRWIKAANSLKLKLLVQSRLATGANDIGAKDQLVALIAAHKAKPIFITSPADDFLFRFAKTQNPDNRHPAYQDGYAGGEAAYTYFGSKFMAEMLANRDPRTPFYFKRQTDKVLNLEDPAQKQTAPCSQRDDCVYGYFPISNYVSNLVFQKPVGDLSADEKDYLAGFFGRDRADPSGVPNDNAIRTTVGAYPAGGLFDDEAEAGGNNQGSGDGIFPMITSWMVKFYLIEAQLTVTGADAGQSNEDLLKSALTDQFARVISLGSAADPDASPELAKWGEIYDWPIEYTLPEDYIEDVVSDYTAFTGNKLQFVLKQAWFANYGNGFEIYTAFRRTGFPGDLQEPLQIPRQFALRIPYGQSEVNLNPNTPVLNYDAPENALFWDVLHYQF
ncbi:SusD/RagB family nutrient-binding outer membrane lipoprotein [Chryseolinea sp. T2]|uniref:SusD/RagB family nutrient-binding outer membrane lipoprotein n=1 Tax=Chryseolinea sp. T2 TaxID=3129255 RepID=UPI00307846C8